MVAFALSAPVLAVITVCAVELSFVAADKHKTKDVADAAAIYGAQQFSSAPIGAAQRAQSFALQELASVQSRSTVTVLASVAKDGAVTVRIDTQRDSFFGNMLPAGGFHTVVSSTAIGAGSQPLCVLSTDTAAASNDLHLTATSKLEAGKCLSQSNRNLIVDGAAAATGAALTAVGSATGSITPQAQTGAKSISDPFGALDLTAPTSCNSETANVGNSSVTFQPGLHCNGASLSSNGVLTLAPGVHWFKGNLSLASKSKVDGTQGAALVFMNGTSIGAAGSAKATVSLRGAKTGPLAGFVLLTTRDYSGQFTLPSDAISEITGVVYSPTAKLVIDGTSKAGATSPWTVIVAKGLQLNRSADVVINADYTGTDVPVPKGVGPSTVGGTRLTK